MLRISNIRIGTKLAIVSGMAIVLVLGVVVMQWLGGNDVNTATSNSRVQMDILTRALATKASMRGMQIGVRDIRLATSKDALQNATKYLDDRVKSAHQYADSLPQKSVVPENKARFEKIIALIDNYTAGGKEIAGLQAQIVDLRAKRAASSGDEADAILKQINDVQEKVTHIVTERTLPMAGESEKLLDEAVAVADKRANLEQDSVDVTVSTTQRTGLIIGLITTALLIGSALFSVFSIARPLRALVAPLAEVAAGNFDVTMPGVGRKDEVGLIASAAEAVVEKVGATIGNIKVAATEVTSASAEISTSTTDLSQRTEEQAASLEETSASMEEISATVKKNAENARQANEFATETSAVASRGGAVVSDAVTAMARIEESSRKISDIIGVIDEIARQTNLLALNAAVEAARAGEAGRGFAVVASEVRSLAQRSSQAAKDIKDLITNSNSQVKDGVDLVNKAGQSLNEIVASIKKVATIVADISNASMEQSSGIEQVNKALTQMDEVTQQNSALVEENAATAKTLEQQAKSMDERVAAFRLRANAAREAYATAPAEAGEPEVAEAAPMAKPAPKRAAPRPAPKRAVTGGGPVGRMQTVLATAIQADNDWTEF
jgi:methyl-accepting chemotaxis protein